MATRKRTRRSLGEVTKRDFVAIANILCAHNAPEPLVNGLAKYFLDANPNFDYRRFVKHIEKCKAGTR
jgi:hypothetical protein